MPVHGRPRLSYIYIYIYVDVCTLWVVVLSDPQQRCLTLTRVSLPTPSECYDQTDEQKSCSRSLLFI